MIAFTGRSYPFIHLTPINMFVSVFPYMTNAREVISGCLQNDPAAQKQLYEYYAPQMLQICHRYTKNAEEASAVFQEGFVRMFRSIHQWKEEGELGAWIRNIMVNTSLIWLKENRRMLWTSDEHVSGDHISAPVTDMMQNMEASELADLVRQLPGGYQAIFNLHAIEGYGHAEIAKLLDISEDNSRSQYLRARAYLTALIEKSVTDKPIVYARK
jgi:RNA polymerase sigma factor (sigma-70 family)